MSGSNHRRDDRREPRISDSDGTANRGFQDRGDGPRRDRNVGKQRGVRGPSSGREDRPERKPGDARDARSREGYRPHRSRDDERKPRSGRPDEQRRSSARQAEQRGGEDGGRGADRRDKPRRYDNERKDRFDQRERSRESGRARDDRARDRSRSADRRADRDQSKGGQRASDSRTAAAGEAEPTLPEEAVASELHGEVRRELRSLPKGLADKVAAHLVAAGGLVDSEPGQALAHARYARRRASRIGVVREANGITAYEAGEWNEALTELRAARRMGGGSEHLAIMADCERALGRPERALDLSRGPEAAEIAGQEAVELRIVAAGARRDLGQTEASIVSLQTQELDPQRQDPWSARLFYAYADNLLAADRVQDAFTWFVHAAHADDEGETDAPERLDELVQRLGGADTAEELVASAESAEVTDEHGGSSEPKAETQ